MSVFEPTTFMVTPRSCPPASWAGAAQDGRGYTDVRWSTGPPGHRPGRPRGAKLEGLKYERKVHDVLSAIYGSKYTPSPVIQYQRRNRRRRAIPDGILRCDGQIYILEVKLSHTVDVWEQLMDRYAPLVAILEPGTRLRTVEVCRYYDPALPIPHTKISSLHRPGTGLEVLQWRI